MLVIQILGIILAIVSILMAMSATKAHNLTRRLDFIAICLQSMLCSLWTFMPWISIYACEALLICGCIWRVYKLYSHYTDYYLDETYGL